MIVSPVGRTIAKFILLPVVAVLAHYYYYQIYFAGVDEPPSDFGSGSMFDSIAPRYDFINRILAFGMDVGWRRKMVSVIQESVADNAKPRILDVATGTADVALQLAMAIPHATVVGVDPSAKMLNVGRQKIRDQGFDGVIQLHEADAQDLSSFAATLQRQEKGKSTKQLFDAATMAFGIRNVPDRQQALCQIHSLLRAGSKFCILEFSEPDTEKSIMSTAAAWFIRNVIPSVGAMLSGGAAREYWHLQNSIKDFPSPEVFGQFLQQIVCRDDHNNDEGDDNGDDKGHSKKARDREISFSFHLDHLVQLNFGSVQIYVTTVQ